MALWRRLEHSRGAERVVELAAEHSVELVVVAGDLYDRSAPPADAVELFGSTLVRLHEAGAAVAAKETKTAWATATPVGPGCLC